MKKLLILVSVLLLAASSYAIEGTPIAGAGLDIMGDNADFMCFTGLETSLSSQGALKIYNRTLYSWSDHDGPAEKQSIQSWLISKKSVAFFYVAIGSGIDLQIREGGDASGFTWMVETGTNILWSMDVFVGASVMAVEGVRTKTIYAGFTL